MVTADRWGVIDDESIADARELLGVPLRRDRMQWNKVATRDAIRQFAMGAGDANPLWTDERYAESTRWGQLLAPPSFLYAVDATIVAPRLPGVQWIYAGTRWRWYDVIRMDDAFDVSVTFTELEEKQGRRFGRWVLQKGEIIYRRAGGGLISVAQGRVARTPRRTRSSADSGESDAEPVHEPKPIAPPPGGADSNPRRRGDKPRLWEEVDVGDAIGPVSITLTLEGIYAWYAGAQGALHYGGAHGDAVRYRHRHDDYEINRETGAKDSAARGHFFSKEGKDVGMGGAYDVGLQRIAWVIGVMTDWMGDEAHLAEVDVDVLAPNLIGDTTQFTGVVTDKWIDQHCLVGVDIEGRNQHGGLTTRGRATVVLPSADHGPVVLPMFDGDSRRWIETPSERPAQEVGQ